MKFWDTVFQIHKFIQMNYVAAFLFASLICSTLFSSCIFQKKGEGGGEKHNKKLTVRKACLHCSPFIDNWMESTKLQKLIEITTVYHLVAVYICWENLCRIWCCSHFAKQEAIDTELWILMLLSGEKTWI